MSPDIDPNMRGVTPSEAHLSSPILRREYTTELHARHMARRVGVFLDQDELNQYREQRELPANKSASDHLVLAQVLRDDKLEKFKGYHNNIFPVIQ